MASVHCVGSPFWSASIKVWHADKLNPAAGQWKRTWRSTGIPATEPKAAAEKVAEALQAGALAAAPTNPRRADQRTFVEALESIWAAAGLAPPPISASWRDYSQRFLVERSLGARTRQVYASQFSIFTKHLGKRADDLLWNLGKDDFQSYYNALIKEGRSAKTASNHLSMLQAVMERAFLEGAISRNPVKLVTQTVGEQVERQPFTRADVRAILEFLDNPPAGFVMPLANATEWKTAVLLGLCCGLRIQDAIGRAWRDFDLMAGTISLLPAKKIRKGKFITLPLARPLAAHLSTLDADSEWVTPDLRGKRRATPSFLAIADAAGIDAEKGGSGKGKGRTVRLRSFHSLRHSLNTWLAEAGAEKQVRMLISDHDDPRISDKYTHGVIDRLAEALRKVFPE